MTDNMVFFTQQAFQFLKMDHRSILHLKSIVLIIDRSKASDHLITIFIAASFIAAAGEKPKCNMKHVLFNMDESIYRLLYYGTSIEYRAV